MEEGGIHSFVDQAEILNDDVVYRRVSWQHLGGKERNEIGAVVALSPNVFRDQSVEEAQRRGLPGPCMSVGLRSILLANQKGPNYLLEGFPDYGLAEVQVGELRRLRKADGSSVAQGLMLNPTVEEPWHVVVFDRTTGKKSAAVSKAITRVATWAVPLVR